MTVGINMVKIHDCAGGKTDTGTDGLCAVTALIFSAGLSSGLAARAGSDAAQLFAVCTMGAAGGFSLLGVQSCEALFGRVGCAGDWWSYDYGGAAFGRIFRFPAGRCGGGR